MQVGLAGAPPAGAGPGDLAPQLAQADPSAGPTSGAACRLLL